MNLRSQAILLALDHVSSSYRGGEPLNIIEIGCMFKEDEGLSTYLIADFLVKRAGGNRFVSIDYDLDHINASKVLIQNRNSYLSSVIEYRHGPSLSVLPEVLTDLNKVHFFYLDGGAHPEVCLVEFEQAMMHLAPEGVILVDDVQQIAPSKYWRLPRPLGKATLILPMLIIANYLPERGKMRATNAVPGDQKSIPRSHFIGQLKNIDVPAVNASNFNMIGSRHRMLAYGSPTFIVKTRQLTETVGPSEIGRSPISAVKQKIGRLVSKYRRGIQREFS